MKDIRVLVVGYECAPFYKRGGLGDVMEALPKALFKVGVDARAVVPYYDEIRKEHNFKKEGEFTIKFYGKTERVEVYPSTFPNTNVPIYFLQNKGYLSRSRAKDKTKRMGQFAFFDLAIVEFAVYLGKKHKWHPSVIHCNDWHTALIPLILKKIKLPIPTLLTIHNLLYQGVGSLKVLELLDIQEEEAKALKKGVPANEMNVLGEGIVHATRVSTVSPTYAKEIAEENHHRNPISPFLVKREMERPGRDGDIIGILNGIDCDIWDPAKDELIFHKYDVSNWEVGKMDNKQDLLKNLGLENRPTFCFVGRLAKQKGLDILIKTIDRSHSLNINVIILGSGDPKIKKKLLKFAESHSSWVKFEPIYSEELAHKLYAGSDFIIVPSRYEPCGLIQMIGMKYGTLPIASNTGGLKDSILNGKNGFLFRKGRSLRLKKAITRALNMIKDRNRYKKMVERAMRTNLTWDKSAVLYRKLYKQTVKCKQI